MATTSLLLLRLLMGIAPAVAISAGSCSSVTSDSITISWNNQLLVDWYALEYSTLAQRGLGQRWSVLAPAQQKPSVRVTDLKPNTTVYFWLRPHISLYSRRHGLSKGWRAFSPMWSCDTTAAAAAAPTNLRRVGGVSTSNLTLQWTPGTVQAGGWDVRWRVLGEATWQNVTARRSNVQLQQLRPAAQYEVEVCTAGATGGCCGSVFRTAAAGNKYVSVYRVSEYGSQAEVDFLSDHDSADIFGQALYMSGTENSKGVFQPFHIQNATIVRYCIEALDQPWADYVSCNIDIGPVAINSCICAAKVDRMYARQNASVLDDTCWGPVCECDSSKLKYSQHTIGKQPIYWPGPGFFKQSTHNNSYPLPAVPCGEWYSTPHRGECSGSSVPGTGGCSWRLLADSWVVTGEQLLTSGWNASAIHNTAPKEQVFQNAKVLTEAFLELAEVSGGRCCGC